MGSYRRAKLALDAFRTYTSKILPKSPNQYHFSAGLPKSSPNFQIPQSSSNIYQIGSSISTGIKGGFSFSSSISQKSGIVNGISRFRYNPLACGGAKRFYYVDQYRIQHFRPRGPKRWFENPRKVLIAVVVGSGVFITVYFGNTETIPYTKRTHLVLLSRDMEKRIGEQQLEQMKQGFKGKILPAIHPVSVRVRLISKDIINALQRGLSHEHVWRDLGYASTESVGVPEGSGIEAVMAMREGSEKVEGKWYGAEDEILDDKWVDRSRKKGQDRGSQTGHLDGLNWEVVVVNEPVVNACCLPGGKIVVFTGLLEHFRTDDEIATIIAHEVGHVVARHAAEGITKNLWFAVLQLFLYMFVTPDIVDAMSTLFLRLPFSRRMEVEADYIGLLLLASAGYDPRVAPRVYERLGQITGESAVRDYLSTHPSGKKRAKLLAEARVMEEAVTIYREVRSGKGVEGFL